MDKHDLEMILLLYCSLTPTPLRKFAHKGKGCSTHDPLRCNIEAVLRKY